MCACFAAPGFPEQYNGAAFIVEHGSWARATKIGYRVATVMFAPNGTLTDYQVFVEGFLEKDGTVWGEQNSAQDVAYACIPCMHIFASKHERCTIF